MRDNERIENALGPDQRWQEAYAFIEAHAKPILEVLEPGEQYTSGELAEALYDGEDDYTWDRLYRALKALSEHGLKEYATKGEKEKIGNVMGHRTLWHAAKKVCGECGRPL